MNNKLNKNLIKGRNPLTDNKGYYLLSSFIAVLFLIYEELILNFSFSINTIYILLFSLFFGILYRVVFQKMPYRVKKYLTPIILFTVCFVYATEFFIKKSFQVYISIFGIKNGAGDMVGGFSDVILATVFKGFFTIILFFMPFILYFLIKRLRLLPDVKAKNNLIISISSLVIFLALTLCFNSFNALSKDFFFDNSVSTFGLCNSIILDVNNALHSNNKNFNVQTAKKAEKEVKYNKSDIDFAKKAELETDEAVKNIDLYVAATTPSEQNKYTGLFKGKNLILITAEAFSLQVIDEKRTPTLYRLFSKGINFKEYYQPVWGGSTSTGEYSVITGLIPVFGVNSIKKTIGKNMAFTMGNMLKNKGYTSYAYHNGSYTYYDRNLTHENLGYEKFTAMGNGMEKGVKKQWPESDLEMFSYTSNEYLNKSPFSVYYMTVSGHCLYKFNQNKMAKKNENAVKDVKASEAVKGYLASQQELENGLTFLVNKLEELNLADDTVIVLSTDHYPYGLEKSDTWGNKKDYLSELYGFVPDTSLKRDRSALIIWSGCLEKEKPIVVKEPTYSLDILPTLLNLFGLEYDSRLLVGRDVFSNETPLVIYPDHSFLTDKGFCSAEGKFMPANNETVTDDYVQNVKNSVENKFVLSKNVIESNYYNTLKMEENK